MAVNATFPDTHVLASSVEESHGGDEGRMFTIDITSMLFASVIVIDGDVWLL